MATVKSGVVVDRMSKMVLVISVKGGLNAAELSNLYLYRVVYRGVSMDIVSDRDKLFTAEIWASLQHRLDRLSVAPKYPEADGQMERVNTELARDLLLYFLQRDWEDWLPIVEFRARRLEFDGSAERRSHERKPTTKKKSVSELLHDSTNIVPIRAGIGRNFMRHHQDTLSPRPPIPRLQANCSLFVNLQPSTVQFETTTSDIFKDVDIYCLSGLEEETASTIVIRSSVNLSQ